MRKLKLQMHLSVDNYVNMERGGNHFKWDSDVIQFCVTNLNNVDTLILGRKTAEELIPFWDGVAANEGHADFALGKRISELPKIVFSNTTLQPHLKNTTLMGGNISNEIKRLKSMQGKDMLVYGGASFASSLVENNLVDEFCFLLNPFCLGEGLTIFNRNKHIKPFTLLASKSFPCGTVMVSYQPNHS